MPKLNHTILFVSDMSRSVAFYRDKIGLKVKMESPYWTEFDSGTGTTIALHLAEAAAVKLPLGHGKTPAGQTQFGFGVEDIDAYHATLTRHGVPCHMPPTMQDFGAKLALYEGPDGEGITIAGAH